MIKLIIPVLFILLCFSCNSNPQKTTKTTINQSASDLKSSMARGKLTYNEMCITCHLANGEGVPKAFPPLVNSDFLKENQVKSIIGIKKGMSGEIVVNGVTYNSIMSPLGLSDNEVADVMNYINNSWDNKYGELITAEDVTKVIKKQD